MRGRAQAERLAIAGLRAYNKVLIANGHSPFKPFEELSDDMQEAWEGAAEAIEETVLAEPINPAASEGMDYLKALHALVYESHIAPSYDGVYTGFKVRRKAWGNGIFVMATPCYPVNIALESPRYNMPDLFGQMHHTLLVTVPSRYWDNDKLDFEAYTPTVTDMLATDWEFVDHHDTVYAEKLEGAEQVVYRSIWLQHGDYTFFHTKREAAEEEAANFWKEYNASVAEALEVTNGIKGIQGI